MPGYIGIDTHHLKINYQNNGVDKRFESLVGVGVSAQDYEKFCEAYEEAINKTIKFFGIKTNKKILCNFDLLKLWSPDIQPHEFFFKEIAPHIESIDVFWTLFSPSRKMRWMGRKEKELKHRLSKPDLELYETLNKLANSFPMICIWRIKDFLKKNGILCLIDSCSLKPSESWEEIKDDIDINMFFSGDTCNPLISTADIMIKIIDSRRSRERKLYEYKTFRNLLPELNGKVYEYSISHRHYKKISPLTDKQVNLRDYVKHPVFYILNENPEFMDSAKLKTDSSIDKLYNLAAGASGCVKVYYKKSDKIKTGDYVAYFTENGKSFVEYLKKMGKKVNGIDMSELNKS